MVHAAGHPTRPKSRTARLGEWVSRLPWRQLLGSLCVVVGIGFTVWLAVLGTGKKPPTLSESALLVLASAVSSLGGARFFNSVGRADPSLARSAVRRLTRMAERAKETRQLAEIAFEGDASKQGLHDFVGTMSAYLSYFEEDAVMAIEDWKEFHKNALRAITRDGSDG